LQEGRRNYKMRFSDIRLYVTGFATGWLISVQVFSAVEKLWGWNETMIVYLVIPSILAAICWCWRKTRK